VIPLEAPATAAIEPPPVPAALPAANATADGTGDGRAAPQGETRHVEEPEVRRTRIWRRADAEARAFERQMERRFRRLFARQVTSTIARLEGKRGRQSVEHRADLAAPDPAAIFDAAFWTAETREAAEDLFEAITVASAGRVAARLGVDFDVSAPYAQDFIAARANQLAGQVTETTYEAIRVAMAEGVAAGESIPDIAARVRHVFEVASDARATTIARTEVISAYNGSALAVANAYGPDVAGGQEWIATRDGRVRAEHADADGQVVAIGETFDVGGEALAYPGDPNGSGGNTVNCRCTVAILTPDEMTRAAAPSERRVAVHLARAVLAMVRPGEALDELGIRRALREAA
jgi:uncharacterized protein YoaH (UPF0181 family)